MGAFTRPIEVLLVEDNPGDVRLTKEALKEGRVINNLSVVHDGVEAMDFLQDKLRGPKTNQEFLDSMAR